jgi:hypothetical protein
VIPRVALCFFFSFCCAPLMEWYTDRVDKTIQVSDWRLKVLHSIIFYQAQPNYSSSLSASSPSSSVRLNKLSPLQAEHIY